MRQFWRVDKATRSKEESFSGEGAAITGGRWNHPGVRVAYTSGSLSLAELEKFVHLGNEGRYIRWAAYTVIVPGNLRIERLDPKFIPRDWREYPPPASTMDIGTEWIRRGRTAVFEVPSVIVPIEFNYLLNPLHPDFPRLQILRDEKFRFDDRLWKA